MLSLPDRLLNYSCYHAPCLVPFSCSTGPFSHLVSLSEFFVFIVSVFFVSVLFFVLSPSLFSLMLPCSCSFRHAFPCSSFYFVSMCSVVFCLFISMPCLPLAKLLMSFSLVFATVSVTYISPTFLPLLVSFCSSYPCVVFPLLEVIFCVSLFSFCVIFCSCHFEKILLYQCLFVLICHIAKLWQTDLVNHRPSNQGKGGTSNWTLDRVATTQRSR